MKFIFLVLFSLFSISTFAGVTVELDFQSKEGGKKVKLQKIIETHYDDIETMKIGKSERFIELQVTDKVPEILLSEGMPGKQILISLEIYEVENNKKKIFASPKVVTLLGENATFTMFDNTNSKEPITSIKLKATEN